MLTDPSGFSQQLTLIPEPALILHSESSVMLHSQTVFLLPVQAAVERNANHLKGEVGLGILACAKLVSGKRLFQFVDMMSTDYFLTLAQGSGSPIGNLANIGHPTDFETASPPHTRI